MQQGYFCISKKAFDTVDFDLLLNYKDMKLER